VIKVKKTIIMKTSTYKNEGDKEQTLKLKKATNEGTKERTNDLNTSVNNILLYI